MAYDRIEVWRDRDRWHRPFPQDKPRAVWTCYPTDVRTDDGLYTVFYRGRVLLGPTELWRCGHRHVTGQAARECADAELARRTEAGAGA